jgi:hypothetical protein
MRANLNNHKLKKINIIATWIGDVYRKYERSPDLLAELQAHAYTCSHLPMMEDCPRITLEDAYYIFAEIEKVAGSLLVSSHDAAIAIMKGINGPTTTLSEAGLKRCSGCGQNLPIEEFHHLQNYCKVCKSIWNSQRYIK